MAQKLKEQKLSVNTQDGPMELFVVFPENTGKPRPAMIVLQEAFGVSNHIQEACRRLAAHGYVAVAPELFHREGHDLQFGYDEFATKILPVMGRLTNDHMAMDMAAAMEWLKTQSAVDSQRIGTIGFCMGGFAAVLGAIKLPIQAAVSFYGGGLTKARSGIGFTPLVGEVGSIKCPLLLAYGAEDHGIPPEDIQTMRHALDNAGVKHDERIYANAGHGFLCEDRSAYRPDVAEVAWKETIVWLDENL